jgi:hypothetical protein
MKEPGLDGRHRDENPPKAGEIQQKRSDALNKNLPKPIPQFSPTTTLGQMREATGKVSEEAERRAAAKMFMAEPVQEDGGGPPTTASLAVGKTLRSNLQPPTPVDSLVKT